MCSQTKARSTTQQRRPRPVNRPGSGVTAGDDGLDAASPTARGGTCRVISAIGDHPSARSRDRPVLLRHVLLSRASALHSPARPRRRLTARRATSGARIRALQGATVTSECSSPDESGAPAALLIRT